jgi:hypothetical protein
MKALAPDGRRAVRNENKGQKRVSVLYVELAIPPWRDLYGKN